MSGWPHLKLGALRLLLPGPLHAPRGEGRLPPARGAARGDARPAAGRALRPGAPARPPGPRSHARAAACASASTASERGDAAGAARAVRPASTRWRCARRDTRPFTTRLTRRGRRRDARRCTATLRPGPRARHRHLRARGRDRARGRARGRAHAAHRRSHLGRARGRGRPGRLRARAARRITVVAEQPLTVPLFRLEPLPGRLRLTSEPAGAAVSVDGRFRGETPLELDGARRARARGARHEGRTRAGGGDASPSRADEARPLSPHAGRRSAARCR